MGGFETGILECLFGPAQIGDIDKIKGSGFLVEICADHLGLCAAERSELARLLSGQGL